MEADLTFHRAWFPPFPFLPTVTAGPAGWGGQRLGRVGRETEQAGGLGQGPPEAAMVPGRCVMAGRVILLIPGPSVRAPAVTVTGDSAWDVCGTSPALLCHLSAVSIKTAVSAQAAVTRWG